jgi:hypothetical protein
VKRDKIPAVKMTNLTDLPNANNMYDIEEQKKKKETERR